MGITISKRLSWLRENKPMYMWVNYFFTKVLLMHLIQSSFLNAHLIIRLVPLNYVYIYPNTRFVIYNISSRQLLSKSVNSSFSLVFNLSSQIITDVLKTSMMLSPAMLSLNITFAAYLHAYRRPAKTPSEEKNRYQ